MLVLSGFGRCSFNVLKKRTLLARTISNYEQWLGVGLLDTCSYTIIYCRSSPDLQYHARSFQCIPIWDLTYVYLQHTLQCSSPAATNAKSRGGLGCLPWFREQNVVLLVLVALLKAFSASKSQQVLPSDAGLTKPHHLCSIHLHSLRQESLAAQRF